MRPNEDEDMPTSIGVLILLAVVSVVATCAAIPVMAWRFAVGG